MSPPEKIDISPQVQLHIIPNIKGSFQISCQFHHDEVFCYFSMQDHESKRIWSCRAIPSFTLLSAGNCSISKYLRAKSCMIDFSGFAYEQR